MEGVDKAREGRETLKENRKAKGKGERKESEERKMEERKD